MNSQSYTSNPVILLSGADGQVGWELRRTLTTLGNVVACGRQYMDLANADSIRRVIRNTKPNLIVNAAAYTNVDKAEQEASIAMAVNGTAPGIMAEEALSVGAGLVHFSTDFVFDGMASRPYREDDITNPLSSYGQSKLAGERALHQVGAAFLILRTGWVYGRRGRNFLLTVQRLARERKQLRFVDDQIGTPTWCRLLAEATAQLLVAGVRNLAEYVHEHGGIYHLSCSGATSWYGFAKRILKLSPDDVSGRFEIAPIRTSDYATAAARPAYSVLDNTKASGTFGVNLPSWEHALSLALES